MNKLIKTELTTFSGTTFSDSEGVHTWLEGYGERMYKAGVTDERARMVSVAKKMSVDYCEKCGEVYPEHIKDALLTALNENLWQ